MHDLLPMLFDGFHAQSQFARDLLVGLAFGNELQHFCFPRRQMIVPDRSRIILGRNRLPVGHLKAVGNGRAQHPAAALHNGSLVDDLQADFLKVKAYLNEVLAPPPPLPPPPPADPEQLRLI